MPRNQVVVADNNNNASISGSFTAGSIIRSGGLATQFLMANGSVSTNPGWITGYTETDTLATVTARGASTNTYITQSGTADWYMYGFGARGASAGQYGIGLTADIANRTLSFHVPDIAAYSNSGNTPRFGWYSNNATELMTLQSATGNLWVRGTLSAGRITTTGLYGPSTSGNIPIWQYDASNPGYGIVYFESNPDLLRIDVTGQALSGTPDFLIGPDYAQVNGNTVWHAGNLTNLNQLTNGPGYITQSTGDGRYLLGTTSPSTPGNFTLSIGNNGSYSYVQSHSSQPLELNPVGNTVRIAGNVVWHQGNLTNLNQLTNGPGYTSNTGTVTSVGGTGTVSGLTLSGTVTSSGNLTLGGTLSASIDNITDEHRLFNNMGDNHGTRTSFDATTPSYNFGFRFVQGNTNGPALGGGGQFYSWYLGLGNDYPATGAGSYGMHVAIPRSATTPYMSIRYNENNSLGSWIKIAAGYADTAGALTSMNISQFTNNSGYVTGGPYLALSGGTMSGQLNAISTAGGDHGLRVGAVRGSAVGSQSGDYIMLYERVHIGYPSGWGATQASAPTYGLGVWGNIHVSQSNATGGGIILADDGDIVDLNDAWCSMRFTSGVRIYSANRGGSAVISLGSNGVISAGNISTGVTASHIVQRDANGYIYANHINFNTSESENPTISSFFTSNGDGWSRKSSIAHVRNQLGNYGNWITASSLSSYLPLSGGTMTGNVQFNANLLQFNNSGVRSWNMGISGGNLNIYSGDGSGSLLYNGRPLRDSYYRTYSGFSDYYSGGTAGWYRVAEITLTGNCSGAVIFGTLYDNRYDGADAYQISVVARSECDFSSNNESHYINVGCTILGSTNYSNYRDKIRVVLSASSTNSRTYELQFYETPWNHDTWQIESTGWTVYTSPQAPSAAVGTPRVNYISKQNADNLLANTAVYSPVYYDIANSSYYLDLNSTTSLRTVGSWRSDSSSWDGEFSGKIQYHSNHWYIQGADLLIYRNSGGSNVFTVNQSGTAQATSDFRAPIFYDSNDTAYYLNPAGGSRLRNLYVGDSGDDWSDPGGWGTQVRFSNGPHVRFVLHARSPGIEAGMYVHTPGSVYIGSYTSHDVSMMYAGNRKMQITNSYIYTDVYLEAAGSLRAPIFYDSNDTNYYVDPNSNSYLSRLHVADASSGVSMHVGVGSTHGVYTLDNARKYLVVSGDYYPHMALVARYANNTNHGAVFSFVGSEGGAFRQWNLGISNNNPFLFSIGYNRTSDPNPHYGVGDGWSGSDFDHARLSIDRDGNTKIRGMLYVNGTSGGISTGSAVIHAGNIGSQSVSYASNAGSLGGLGASAYLRDDGWNNYPGQDANTQGTMMSDFSYSNNCPWTGELIRFGASGYSLQFNSQYQGTGLSFRSRNGDNGNWNAWSTVIHSNNIGSQSVSYASSAGSVAWGNITSRPDWMASASLIAGLSNANSQVNSGFYENGGCGSNWPSCTWYNSINVRHSNQGNYHGFQIAMSYYDNNLWFRSYQGSGTFQSWSRALGTTTDPYPSNMNQYVRTTDAVTFGGATINISGSNVTAIGVTHTGSISSSQIAQGLAIGWSGYGASFAIVYKQGELSPSDMCHIYNVGGFYMKIFDGSSNRFHRWDDNGSVSINSSSQGSYTFNVTGDIYATADVIAFSDARVKEDVRTVENALDKVIKLRGVTYIKKDEENKKRKMGVIAQEVLEVLPEVVHEDNDGYYGVSYGNIVGVLIEAIKEQQKQIDELKQELKNK